MGRGALVRRVLTIAAPRCPLSPPWERDGVRGNSRQHSISDNVSRKPPCLAAMPLPDPTDHDPIQGPRLRLRPITPDDLPDLLRWLHDPEVVKFYGPPPPDLAAVRGEYMEPCRAPHWTFIIDDGGRPIGEIQYAEDFAGEPWSAGIDIFIGNPDARNCGLGTEAVRTLLQYLFETKGLNRVSIDPTPSNRRAIRAYEKAGFRLDGVLRRHMRVDGRWADIAFMTILDDEWPAAKARWHSSERSR